MVQVTVISYHLLEQFTKIKLKKRLHSLCGDSNKTFKQPQDALSNMFD
jgi:hypothetical protein